MPASALLLLLAATDCDRVLLQGEEALVSAAALALQQRGVRTGTGSEPAAVRLGCQPLVALETRGERVALRLDGEPQEREVSDLQVAAVLIESWARRDLSEPLFAPRAAPQRIAPPEGPRQAAPLGGSSGRRMIPAPEPWSVPVMLSARAALAVSGDGATWLGGQAMGALSFGALTPCVELRLLSGRHRAELTQTAAARLDTQLLAGAGYELHLGALALTPGLAVGLGWLHSARSLDERSTACDGVPSGQACDPNRAPVIRDSFQATTLGFRAEARLSASMSLDGPLRLTAGAALQLSPMARSSLVPSYAAVLGEAEAARLGLGAEPSVLAMLSLGLGWEGR